MAYLVGVALALAVAGACALAGLERERAFYPVALIVIAMYYVLFATMDASGGALFGEIAVAIVFVLVAFIGFKRNLWFVAGAIVGHGVFDFVHHLLIHNAGMPSWWPGFCMSFDVVFGLVLAVRLVRRDARP